MHSNNWLRTGKWNKHIDGWDCLEDQEFFSIEGFAFVLRQMLQVSKPPNRLTPEFCILKKYKDWEIRRFDQPQHLVIKALPVFCPWHRYYNRKSYCFLYAGTSLSSSLKCQQMRHLQRRLRIPCENICADRTAWVWPWSAQRPSSGKGLGSSTSCCRATRYVVLSLLCGGWKPLVGSCDIRRPAILCRGATAVLWYTSGTSTGGRKSGTTE